MFAVFIIKAFSSVNHSFMENALSSFPPAIFVYFCRIYFIVFKLSINGLINMWINVFLFIRTWFTPGSSFTL